MKTIFEYLTQVSNFHLINEYMMQASKFHSPVMNEYMMQASKFHSPVMNEYCKQISLHEYLSTKIHELDKCEEISIATGIPYKDIKPLYDKYWNMNKLPEPFKKLKDNLLLFENPFKLLFAMAFIAIKNGYDISYYREIYNSKELNDLGWFDIEDRQGEKLFYLISNIIDSFYIVNVDFEKMYKLISKYSKDLTIEDIEKL